jgi:acyl carrier protein
MTITTIEEFIALLDRNSFSIEDYCGSRIGDWDYEAASFAELGFDGLDIVEMIMEIEKVLNCEIRDSCAELIEDMNPNDLTKRVRRMKRLDDLGI